MGAELFYAGIACAGEYNIAAGRRLSHTRRVEAQEKPTHLRAVDVLPTAQDLQAWTAWRRMWTAHSGRGAASLKTCTTTTSNEQYHMQPTNQPTNRPTALPCPSSGPPPARSRSSPHAPGRRCGTSSPERTLTRCRMRWPSSLWCVGGVWGVVMCGVLRGRCVLWGSCLRVCMRNCVPIYNRG